MNVKRRGIVNSKNVVSDSRYERELERIADALFYLAQDYYNVSLLDWHNDEYHDYRNAKKEIFCAIDEKLFNIASDCIQKEEEKQAEKLRKLEEETLDIVNEYKSVVQEKATEMELGELSNNQIIGIAETLNDITQWEVENFEDNFDSDIWNVYYEEPKLFDELLEFAIEQNISI